MELITLGSVAAIGFVMGMYVTSQIEKSINKNIKK